MVTLTLTFDKALTTLAFRRHNVQARRFPRGAIVTQSVVNESWLRCRQPIFYAILRHRNSVLSAVVLEAA